MKKRISILAAIAVISLLFSSCGSSSGSSQVQSSQSSETESIATETTASESISQSESEASETQASESESQGPVHPYAWQGLEDIPQCNYLDIFCSNHFIQVYDSYISSYLIEETQAVDGINTFKGNENTRTWSVDGKILTLNEGSKIYMEYDMSDSIDSARDGMEGAMASGTNYLGRRFVEKGSGVIPIYSDKGDTAEYEYYEYDYPATEGTGSTMIERYYMKDGDVYAIYTEVSSDSSTTNYVNVIKSISGDIPEGTFDFPSLDGYEKYE